MRRWIAFLLLLTPFSAYAWDNKGHRIVAMFAEKRLGHESAALKQALALLGTQHLADVATLPDFWATRIGSRHTAGWHFVNIPIQKTVGTCLDEPMPRFDRDRDCKNSICLVDAVNRSFDLFNDLKSSSDPDERARAKEALIYLIHLIADLHQPMHCASGKLADGSSDRNGTLIPVTVNGGHVPGNVSGDPKNDNLHFVWDVSLIEWKKLDEAAYVEHLFEDTLGNRSTNDLTFGPVTRHAEFAHTFAECAQVPPHTDLKDAYMDEQGDIVDEELMQAGMGLADALRIAFRSN